jgi:HD-GYP domain-containing protein (c-di-GMP phosphodiesterase class II)
MSSAVRASIAAGIIALLGFVGLGAFLINAYIEQERQRDLLEWESRLGLVADAKSDAIHRLLSADQRDLQELAGNASLRFYLWQLGQGAAAAGDAGAADSGAGGYLRNLLIAAAERYGYGSASGSRLPASVAQPRSEGLVIFDSGLRPVIATPGLVDVAATFASVAREALAGPGRRGAILMRDAQDSVVVVTAVAVNAVPGTRDGPEKGPLGVLLGIRSAERELFPLLVRGPSFAEENESILLALQGDTVALLSPTQDGSPGLRRTLPAERTDIAEVAAMNEPRRFFALDNYRGRPVLQVSRQIRGQDGWLLVQQVNTAAALSLANERRRFLLLALSLLLFSIVTVTVAAWRHGSSVRARHQAEELADKARRLQKQTDLLHTTTDNLDVLTLLVSRDERVLFVNRAAATAAGRAISDVLGSTLASFLPAELLRDLKVGIGAAREQGQATHRLLQWEAGDAPRAYNASFIPVDRIGNELAPVLVVLSDVTELEQVHKRNTDLLRGLVLTLVSAVDRHDPFSAHHARRMTEVVDALARELGFSDRERGILDLAASLANIGKIMIPVEILTKQDPLSAAEQELLRRHVDYGLELLRGLQFDGPVMEIIAQKQERLDGRGYPQGLSGERITLAGQVLAVANAFVALVSSRAYRQGLSVRDALAELMRGAGTEFDRRVVAALFHVAENRHDWSQWTG